MTELNRRGFFAFVAAAFTAIAAPFVAKPQPEPGLDIVFGRHYAPMSNEVFSRIEIYQHGKLLQTTEWKRAGASQYGDFEFHTDRFVSSREYWGVRPPPYVPAEIPIRRWPVDIVAAREHYSREFAK